MGLLWPGLTGTYGDVFGLSFTIEGIAFFIEAILVAIYIHGWRRLRPWMHFWLGVPVPVISLVGWLATTRRPGSRPRRWSRSRLRPGGGLGADAVLPGCGTRRSVAQQAGRWAGDDILADLDGAGRRPFEYHDQGIMAMIGRKVAVAEIGEKRHELHGGSRSRPGAGCTPSCWPTSTRS